MDRALSEGFEEIVARRTSSSSRRTSTARRRRICDAVDVEPGWEERWREFHRPVRVGPFWIGPPWETPPADAVPLVIDPGRAFGTGAHATTRLCVELLAELEPGSLLDVGTRLGHRRDRRRPSSASRRCSRVDVDPAAVEAARANAAVNAVAIDVREARRDDGPLPQVDVAVANISLALVESLLPRVDARIVVDVRLPRERRAAARAVRAPRAPRARRLGRGPARTRGVESRRHGDLRRSLPRLQGVASRRAGRSRAAARRRPHRRADGDIAVVNTCCVTHEAVSKSRQAAARAARTHRRVYVDRLRREPRRRRSRRPARQRRRRRRGAARRHRPRSPPTSARSAASTTTRGSSAFAHS